MGKIQISLVISLILTLITMSFILAASYPAPFVTGGDPQEHNNNPAKYINCPEGTSLTSYTEASSSSPTGFSTTYECKKRESGNIQINLQPFTVGTISGGSVASLEPQTPTKEKSQAEIDCIKKGCFLNNVCSPFGFVNDGTYCSEKGKVISTGIYRPAFVNQSETGQSCTQSYECKTGICSNNLCTDLTSLKDEINTLRDNLTALSQQNTELNSSLSETKQSVEENNNLLQKVVDFLKTWFGFS